MYKTAAYAALASVHAQETRSEQMRLLYVALTRAQDKLILTVPLGMTKTGNPFAKAAAFLAAGAGETLNQQAGSFADWLRAALLVHPDGGVLRQLSGNRELLFVQTESVMAIKVCDDAVQLSEEIDTDTPDEAPETDPALVEKLRQGFAWQYPAAALAQVPAKVSVTSIVHKAEQTTLERPAFLSKDGLTAAEMGALQPEVAQEPAMALEAGEDGLVFYRALAQHYQKLLRPGGALVLEIGWQQREAVTALLAANGWADIACRKDFGGNDRCMIARRPG